MLRTRGRANRPPPTPHLDPLALHPPAHVGPASFSSTHSAHPEPVLHLGTPPMVPPHGAGPMDMSPARHAAVGGSHIVEQRRTRQTRGRSLAHADVTEARGGGMGVSGEGGAGPRKRQKRQRSPTPADPLALAPAAPPSSSASSPNVAARGRSREAKPLGQAAASSSTPLTQMSKEAARDAFRKIFGGRTNTARFYDTLEVMAELHREHDASTGPSAADRFVELMRHDQFRDKVATKVRVSANKGPGEKRGTGLDELFKTSFTLEWFKRAAGMVVDVEPIGNIAGFPGEISWLRLQQLFRAVTSDVPYRGGDGHTGFLMTTDGKPLTTGQADAHTVRNDAILRGADPAEGLLAAIKSHVETTANEPELTANLNIEGIDSFGLVARVAKQRAQIIERLLRVRDQWKLLRVALGGRSSSLSPARSGVALENGNPNVLRSIARSIPIGKLYRGYVNPELFSGPSKAPPKGAAKKK